MVIDEFRSARQSQAAKLVDDGPRYGVCGRSGFSSVDGLEHLGNVADLAQRTRGSPVRG
jgi:hypothetical protein